MSLPQNIDPPALVSEPDDATESADPVAGSATS
jgi:hypothetical protein